MAYSVKYVGECLKNGIDLYPLIERDLKKGNKVVLVCDREYSRRVNLPDITWVTDFEQVYTSGDKLFLLTADKNSMIVGAQFVFASGIPEYQIYTKYDGIYSADPSDSPFARRLEKIDYDEMLEMCATGYNAVNAYVVELCKKHGVALRILSYYEPDSLGTLIKEVMGVTGLTVKGIIKEPDVAIVSLRNIPDVTGICYKIFKEVSDAGVIVDIINLPASFDGTADMSFTVKNEDLSTVKKVLSRRMDELGFSEIVTIDEVAKISVIGAALRLTKGVATKVFEVLRQNNINLMLINTSEIKIAVVIDKKHANVAVEKIHEVFIE